MTDLGRIATLIENRYREHSLRMRHFWKLSGSGPRLEVEPEDEDHATLRLRGRTVTLANRRFEWTHGGGDGTLLELLGHASSAKPLDHQLLKIATTQALRAAIARAAGAGKSSMEPTRIHIDRSAGTMLVRDHGIAALVAVAIEARACDRHEIVPNDHQVRMAVAGDVQFGVAPCEVDITAARARPPEVRLAAMQLAGSAQYLQGRLHVHDHVLPETLIGAIPGRRLGDVVATGEPLIDDRIIGSAANAGQTLIVRLVEESVEIGEITG